jgi:hypothetical protein
VELPLAISSAAPQVGGAELELPAWIILVVLRAVPTCISQLFWDAASIAGDQEGEAMGWTPE